MLDFKINIKDEQQPYIDISIQLDNIALDDGGVYMFLLDGIPLYIGQSNIFFKRLTEHVYDLGKDKSYFGLGTLSGEHKITYMILKDSLPYNPDYERKEKEGGRLQDANERLRKDYEEDFIDKYRPLTQNPIFYSGDELKNLKRGNFNNSDSMITDNKKRDEIVREGILNHKKCYEILLRQSKCEIVEGILNRDHKKCYKVINDSLNKEHDAM